MTSVDADDTMSVSPPQVVYRRHPRPQAQVCTVLNSFEPRHNDELALQRGSIVEVVSTDPKYSGTTGWWTGRNEEGNVGIFPGSFVQSSNVVLRQGTIDSLPDPVEIDWSEIERLEVIGQGGFCKVYRGIYRSSTVAVKTPRIDLDTIDDAGVLESVRQEARLFSLLKHDNICALIGVSTELITRNINIVLEYCAGGTLRSVLQGKCIAPDILLDWAVQIARGMRYVHDDAPVSIVHRDLKSGNILIKESIDNGFAGLTLKISDFGLAREAYRTTKQQHSTGGTYAWMAPEVIKTSSFSKQSDVWSFGVVLWELLTGETPYRNYDPLSIAYGVAMQKLTLPLLDSFPEELASLIQRCWSQTPTERPLFPLIQQELIAMADSLTDEQEFYSLRESWPSSIAQQLQDCMHALKDMDTKINKEREALIVEREEQEKVREQLDQREQELERREREVNAREMLCLMHIEASQSTSVPPPRRGKSHLKGIFGLGSGGLKAAAVSKSSIGRPTDVVHVGLRPNGLGPFRSSSESPPNSPTGGHHRLIYRSNGDLLDVQDETQDESPSLHPIQSAPDQRTLNGQSALLNGGSRDHFDSSPSSSDAPELPPRKSTCPAVIVTPERELGTPLAPFGGASFSPAPIRPPVIFTCEQSQVEQQQKQNGAVAASAAAGQFNRNNKLSRSTPNLTKVNNRLRPLQAPSTATKPYGEQQPPLPIRTNTRGLLSPPLPRLGHRSTENLLDSAGSPRFPLRTGLEFAPPGASFYDDPPSHLATPRRQPRPTHAFSDRQSSLPRRFQASLSGSGAQSGSGGALERLGRQLLGPTSLLASIGAGFDVAAAACVPRQREEQWRHAAYVYGRWVPPGGLVLGPPSDYAPVASGSLRPMSRTAPGSRTQLEPFPTPTRVLATPHSTSTARHHHRSTSSRSESQQYANMTGSTGSSTSHRSNTPQPTDRTVSYSRHPTRYTRRVSAPQPQQQQSADVPAPVVARRSKASTSTESYSNHDDRATYNPCYSTQWLRLGEVDVPPPTAAPLPQGTLNPQYAVQHFPSTQPERPHTLDINSRLQNSTQQPSTAESGISTGPPTGCTYSSSRVSPPSFPSSTSEQQQQQQQQQQPADYSAMYYPSAQPRSHVPTVHEHTTHTPS